MDVLGSPPQRLELRWYNMLRYYWRAGWIKGCRIFQIWEWLYYRELVYKAQKWL